MIKLSRLVFLSVFMLPMSLAIPTHADFTFVQISDTHTARDKTAYNARYREVIRQVNALKPAFVIHTGDALELWSPESASLFMEISKSLAAPMYVIPGNHDLLNMKTVGAQKAARQVADWKKLVGPDRISFEHEGCVFIGLNYTFWNTGYAAEQRQFRWLESELKKAQGKRIFIFQHAPLFTKTPGEPNGDYYAVENPARGKILDLLKTHEVEAVLTGHYHRPLEASYHGISFLTTPAISFSCAADQGLTGYSVFTVSDGGFTRRFVDLRTKGTPPSFE